MTDSIRVAGLDANGKLHPDTIPAGVGGIPSGLVTSRGDLIAGDSTGKPSRLPVGANDAILVADSTAPGGMKWAPAPLRNFTFYVPGVVAAAPHPAKLLVPAAGLRLDGFDACVDTVGSGGPVVVKLLAGAAEMAELTIAADGLQASNVSVRGQALAAGTFLRLVVSSVPSTPPRDLTVTVWWR